MKLFLLTFYEDYSIIILLYETVLRSCRRRTRGRERFCEYHIRPQSVGMSGISARHEVASVCVFKNTHAVFLAFHRSSLALRDGTRGANAYI